MSANGRRADWVTATMSPNPTAPNTVTVNWMLTKNEISPTVSTTWLWISLIGNQVWLIVAAAAMFAAFPVWYATMFSGYYLALLLLLLLLLVALVVRRRRLRVPRQTRRCELAPHLGRGAHALQAEMR